MKLIAGADPKQIALHLRQCVSNLGQVATSSADNSTLANNYLSWASMTEKNLRFSFVDPDLTLLHTARYWHIRDLLIIDNQARVRGSELVRDEADVQENWLKRLADELEQAADRLAGPIDALTLVVDTSCFHHGPRLDEIDWDVVMHSWKVRIVVPLRVVEELDRQKFYDRSGDVRARARGALQQILAWQATADGAGRASMAGDVTIEVLVPIGARIDGVTGDSEILAAADELATFTGRSVTVATHDVAMQLRATVAGHRVVLMPGGPGES